MAFFVRGISGPDYRHQAVRAGLELLSASSHRAEDDTRHEWTSPERQPPPQSNRGTIGPDERACGQTASDSDKFS